jgi:hypothetical protein
MTLSPAKDAATMVLIFNIIDILVKNFDLVYLC